MKLLIDTDAFCKLGIAGRLADAAGLFGANLSDCGRLAAVPFMLRRGRLFRRYGPEACSVLLAQAQGMHVCPELASASLEPFASDTNIDPGEVQLFAAATQFDITTISGDKRAIRSLKHATAVHHTLAGRIAALDGVLLALCEQLGPERLRQHGLALRLTRPEFENGVFPAGIESFLYQHSVAASRVDLIVDLGVVEDMISDGVATLTKAFLETVPNHAQWRTFTVSACAFPLTMGIVDTHGHELVERTDWISWKENLYNRRSELVRLPNFSDCVIQHPRGVKGFDPRTMSVSASIQYAGENDWLLIKGESTRLTPAVVQFPELATRLVYGHLRPFFLAPPVHCAGCEAMRKAADGAPGYGATEVWRHLGTIHHMSVVMQKLSSLAWP